ncbi:MAG: PD-(D/E)XK nuclease family protein [Candidatus Shikimatogenerans bostrichidophilus]|nr:MAG: PD-(D/E)XK nuclease family protein [Candidatus Shikimatogenerans bostrichidophilus]
MINKIKKIIKLYLKNKKKILIILPNKYYISLIKKIYISYHNNGIIPEIFITKKKLIEKISNLKIVNNLIFFINILYKKNFFKKKKKIKYLIYLLDYYNIIDSNLKNIKKITRFSIDYFKIHKSNWRTYIKKSRIYIYKLYIYIRKKLLKYKKVYYGLALKIAYLNIKKYLKREKKTVFYFIGNNYYRKAEKKIKEKILHNNYKNKDYKNKINKNKNNKIYLIKTFSNVNKYTILRNLFTNNYYKKIKTTIVFTQKENFDLFFKYIYQYKNKINYYFDIDINSLIIHSFIKNLFKIKKYNKNKILYNFLLDFFYNKFINSIISDKNKKKIINYLIKKNPYDRYINLKIKKKNNNIFFYLLNIKLNKIKFFLLLLKTIIKNIYNIYKLNIYENKYLNIVNSFIIDVLHFIKKENKKNLNDIKDLYVLFKFYLSKKYIYNNYNFNKKSFIEVSNVEFIIKESIINFSDNIIIILNKNYEFNLKNKNLYTNKSINYAYKIKKMLKMSNISYIIYHKDDYNFNILNRQILLPFFINKNIKKRKLSILNYNLQFYINNIVKLDFYNKEKKNINEKITFFKKKIGFSYTSIKFYINNPIDFYYKYILNLKSYDYNYPQEFGLIIHKILFFLYKKYINRNLTINDVKEIKKKVKKNNIIKKIYYKYYKNIKGNQKLNYFYNIIKNILLKFINYDEKLVFNGNTLKIISLENKKYKKLSLRKDKDYIKLKVKIDRIDKLNDRYRIIDYKTYLYINNKNVLIYNNEDNIDYLFTEKEYSNILQLLIYSLVFYKKKYKILYNIVCLPNKLKFIKINNNINITYNFLLKFKFILYNYLLKILNDKIITKLSNF